MSINQCNSNELVTIAREKRVTNDVNWDIGQYNNRKMKKKREAYETNWMCKMEIK